MLISLQEIKTYTIEDITGLLMDLGYDNDHIIGLGHEYLKIHISNELKNDEKCDGYSTIIPALLILKDLDLEDFDKIIIGFDGYDYKGLKLKFNYDRRICLFNTNETCSILKPSPILIKSFTKKINNDIRASIDLKFQKRYLIINKLFGTIEKESINHISYTTTANFNVLNFEKDKFSIENYNDVRKLRRLKNK